MTKTKYTIKHRPVAGDFAVVNTETEEVVSVGKTMCDAKEIIANMPNNPVGFGDWGIPNFMKKSA